MFNMQKILQQDEVNEYRAIPFWSWNGKLESKELIRQIHWMEQNGMGGFFMHARSGLKTEYMSEEWMNCIAACTKEAKKLKMDAWLYDENGWPSGFAGGKLLEKEENRDQYILYKIGLLDLAATVSYRIEEERLVRIQPKQVIATTADDNAQYLNLFIHRATSTADILNPKVVDQFIELTHEKYREHFGESFSKEVKGFFTDEPQYQRWDTPYTDMIEEYFREEFGEDILDSLGLLFVEKEGYRKFRYRYWKGMQTLMLRNFAQKIYSWCDEQGVQLTGHYVEEVTLGYQMMCCAGVMPFYEYEHIPGMDSLGRGCNELVPKQVSSVAAQLGKKQVLTETFGCCGWDVSPAELRKIAGFQYANGVNMMCQHLVPYEEYGNRKHDYPAHYSPINPWVAEEFRAFNDYFTRLGYLMAEGKQKVNVAVLHPIRSAYFDYKREIGEEKGFGIAELDALFRDDYRELSKRNIAYHYLDETLLAKYGFVKDASIGCGQCGYEYLILPHLYTMDKETEELLRRYVEQGGKVLLMGDKPSYIEAEEYDYPYLDSNCTLEDIVAAQPYQIADYNTDIYSTCRTLGGYTYIYAVNISQTEEFCQTFSMGEKVKSFLQMDLVTFDTNRVPCRISLKPGEAVLLIADTEAVEESRDLTPYSLIFHDATLNFEENYLPIDCVRYSLDGENYSEKWPCAALFQKLLEDRMEGTLYLKYEFEVRKKPETIYLRVEDCHAQEVYINGIPMEETVPCNIEKRVIAYDIADHIKIGINDYTVKVSWHEGEDVYYALFGENVTESLKNCVVYDSELEPVYLAGNFGVYPTEDYRIEDAKHVSAQNFYIGEIPKKVHDFVTEGLPFVRGPVTLKTRIMLNSNKVLLKVQGFYHAATIYINGIQAGKLLFDKELDISAYAKPGENEVEIRFLIGNWNLLGPQHYSGMKGTNIAPWHFELPGTWEGPKSSLYHDSYDLKTFYERSTK